MSGKKKEAGKSYGGWGGRRANQSGRPKQLVTAAQTTRLVRVPRDIDLQALVGSYQVEAEAAKKASVTGEYPRTYDVALRMLDELAHLLFTAPSNDIRKPFEQ